MAHWWNIKPWESTVGCRLTQSSHLRVKLFINSPLFVRLIKKRSPFFFCEKNTWRLPTMRNEEIAYIWCSSLIRAKFGRETYITIHDVTLDMQREVFMQPHGLCQAEFEMWHIKFNVHVLLTKDLCIKTFPCIIKSAMENVEKINLLNTDAPCVKCTHTHPNITHSPRQLCPSCAKRKPS